MTFSKKPSPPGLNDPVLARQTEADLAKASLIARGKPTVTSAGELILPSTTLSTTSNSFTTTTSANNQTADTVTVTRTSGSVYVSSIDQTIQQTVINNPVAGVSSIIAGNNISITSTGTSGTGDVTITAIVGNIATINLDGNVSNVLRGDGTFSADANSSYGNSNVTSLLGAFGSNTISTTGIITANGANLSNVPYANLTGAPSLGNISSINLDGNVSNLLTGNGTYAAIPVVPTVGNIATLNLDGSNSNVLYGNGVFAAIAGGANTGNVTFDNNIVIGTGDEFGGDGLYLAPGNGSIANSAVQYLRVRGGDFPTHIHLDTGNNQYYDQYFGADGRYVKLEANGNIVINADDYYGNSGIWTFDISGNLNLPVNGNINANGGGITQVINENLNIVVQDEEDDGWSLYNTITDSLGNNLSRTTLDSGSFTITTDITGTNHSWGFEGNTLQVSNDSTIRSFGSNVVLQSMSSGTGGTASLQSVSNTNDPNIFTTFDATTTGANIIVYNGGSNGGVGYTWQFANDGKLTFPGTPRIDTADDNFEVQAAEAINFEANTVVNIYTDAGNNAYQWQFGDDGVLAVPGNLVYVGASPAPYISGFNSVSAEEFTNDTSNVTINANSHTWNFDSTGNLTIPSTSGGFIKTSSNASIGIAAIDNGTNNPAQLLSINAGSGVATSIVSAYSTNVAIQTNAAGTIRTWAFDSAGNLTLPANTFAINYANGTQVSLGGGSNIANGNSNVSIATANGNVTISAVGNTTMTVTGTGANVTGTLTSTGKIGYASGSTVTQTTNRGNGVTINALAGTIITTSVAMVANEIDTFSVINSSVDPNNDIVLAQIVSPNQGTYNCIAGPALIGGFSNGFYINIVNISGFTTSDEALTIRFMVIKAPNA